jgi:hypothetical protein
MAGPTAHGDKAAVAAPPQIPVPTPISARGPPGTPGGPPKQVRRVAASVT